MQDIGGSAKIEAESDNVVFIIPREGDESGRELVWRKVRRGEPICVDLATDLSTGHMFDA